MPTLFHIAGIPPREDFDGEPIPVTRQMQETGGKSEHVNIEFWGEYLVEGNTFYGQSAWANNTYKTVRVVGEEYDLSYTVWCTNDHELYDMKVSLHLLCLLSLSLPHRLGEMGTNEGWQTDPYQLTNLLSTPNTPNTSTTTTTTSSSSFPSSITSYPILPLTARLDALLLTLKRCKGRVCTRPWEKLHPEGNVRNLKDAMDGRYDVFYLEKQKKVTFEECAKGQILSVEGPLEPVSWREEWDGWSWGT